MTDRWPTTLGLSPVVSSNGIRKAFEALAKERWGSRLDAVMEARQMRNAQLAVLADTTPQTIDKVRRGLIIPREHLRYSIAMALGSEVAAIFPLPTREELVARSKQLDGAA